MRVAAAPDHVGVAVWGSRAVSGPEIRVAAIGPGAPGHVPAAASAPTPTPPVATPVPTPEFGKRVVVRPVSGEGAGAAAGLESLRRPRRRSTTSRSAPRSTSSAAWSSSRSKPRTGAVETIRLDGGWFRVAQNRSTTDFTLNEPLASCRRASAAAEQAEVAQAVGQRQGQVPHQGSLQRRDGARHALARPGLLRGDADARHAGQRGRAPRPAEHRRARGQAVPGSPAALTHYRATRERRTGLFDRVAHADRIRASGRVRPR